jgi:hypothetical protein
MLNCLTAQRAAYIELRRRTVYNHSAYVPQAARIGDGGSTCHGARASS